MELNEMIEKINSKRASLDAEDERKKREQSETISLYEKRFADLKDRISKIIKIAECLKSNNIPLGDEYGGYFTGYTLVTNGTDHKLGCYLVGDSIIGIGIKGGGADGYDLVINSEGEIERNPLRIIGFRRDFDRAYWDFCDKCKRFFIAFDEFEMKVENYIKNL